MRLQGGGVNAEFADWLTGLSRNPDMAGPITLPPYIARVSTVDDLCDTVFPPADLANASRDPDFFANRAILAIRNDQLDPINDKLMDQLPGDARTYYAANAAFENGSTTPTDDVTTEFLQSVHLPGLPPHQLRLKVGAPVMLLRNINPAVGLCNGTRLLITRLDAVTFEGRILAGDYKGTLHTIPRMPVPSIEGELPWILTRYQLPVRPCFAMTVNKSQGQTLGVVGVNLQVSPFAHGQLNVAMSRGTDAGSITVLLPDGVDTTVNVNYAEVMEGM